MFGTTRTSAFSTEARKSRFLSIVLDRSALSGLIVSLFLEGLEKIFLAAR